MNQRIIYQNTDGGISIITPTGSIKDCIKDVPGLTEYEIVPADSIPPDRTFRNAWEKSGNTIQHNLTKCKAISHDKRRAKRAAEFAPLDAAATIPARAAQAEADRQAIRDKYAAIQIEIDACATPAALKAIIVREEL